MFPDHISEVLTNLLLTKIKKDMKKLFSILVAVLFAGSMMADEVVIANATFNGKNATYTEGWTTTGTGVTRTDCVVVGAGENITSPTIDLSAYSSISITFRARRFGSLSGSKATISVSYGGTALGTIDVTSSSVGDVSGSVDYTIPEGITASSFVFTCTNAASAGSTHGAGIGAIKITGTTAGGETPPTPTMDYYVVGNMTSWAANADYKLVANPATEGEYMGKFTFAANAEFKVAYSDGTTIEDANWFPTGMDNNYTVTAAGKYNVYFRPDGQGGEGWHYGFIYAAPIVPKTCAEVYNMAKNDEVELLNDVVVTYANGKNVWVRDASASMLIYLPANGTYAAGDTLSGVAGTVDIYNGVHEIKPTDAQVTAITAKAGVAPAAIPVENVQASDVNKYIVMQMVEAVGTFAEGTASNITINGVTVRNNFKNGYTFTADKTYNVYGVVTIYQSNPQVYFISAEEVPGMKGTYTVGGEGADFATLSAACDAIRTQGMRGNVDFVVCADIAETANIGITNTTKFTLTIRPNAAVKRTITFGDIADNVGPSGHVMIGYDMTGWACTDTKNVLIDGSFEGEGRYLEFQAGTVGGVIVVFYGHVEDALVKSCRLINARPSGTSYIGHFRSENSTKIAGSDKAPIMCGFHDCYMQVTNVANTQAIYYNGSQSATADGKPQGCYVTGCEIRSNLRGIFFNGAIGATIADNTFIMENASAGFLAHAIMGNAQKGDIEVFGNRFINLKTNNVSAGDYGLQAITASGGASVWNIYNNYFAGLDALGSVADKAIKLCYIRCGDSCVVRHNSFYMPSLTNKPTTELTSAAPIACLYLAGERKYIVENNLFVSAETTAHNSLIRGALNENVKNNVFFHNGGEAAILAGAEIAADSTAFFALEGTTGSAWAAPVFVDAANGNLDIAVANEALMMPQVADVLDDINGTARGEQTYAGAFEGPEPGQGTSLDMTEVEGVEKIFRNGQVLIIKNGKTYNMMGQVVE